mmetsp:Transcript_2374/g.3346  ORF Transcript_2374/g.3346 Transcript_2374/m.3346 type:complete len:253 (+) Transcript_2374:549-1307(+)
MILEGLNLSTCSETFPRLHDTTTSLESIGFHSSFDICARGESLEKATCPEHKPPAKVLPNFPPKGWCITPKIGRPLRAIPIRVVTFSKASKSISFVPSKGSTQTVTSERSKSPLSSSGKEADKARRSSPEYPNCCAVSGTSTPSPVWGPVSIISSPITSTLGKLSLKLCVMWRSAVISAMVWGFIIGPLPCSVSLQFLSVALETCLPSAMISFIIFPAASASTTADSANFRATGTFCSRPTLSTKATAFFTI